MASDMPCPNPDCPHKNYLRRQDDTGIQLILQSISEVNKRITENATESNKRLGRIESLQVQTAGRVERHSGEIQALQGESKGRIDHKWLMVSAFIGAASTLAASAFGVFKGSK